MSRYGRLKPRKCKFVHGFGATAKRCDKPVDSQRGQGSTHCWDHKYHEAETANNHPGKVEGE